MNNKYLNEENYNNVNDKVKKIGKTLIIVGLVLIGVAILLIIFGFLGFGSQVSNGFQQGQVGVNPTKLFSGFGVLGFGFMMVPFSIFILIVGLIVRFVIGNRREIQAYTTQQSMPVYKETINEMTPIASDAVKEIVKGIRKGLSDKIDE